MKLKSVLVFSAVIASLTFVAIAGGEKEYELKFKGTGQFGYYFDVRGEPAVLVMVFIPYPGPDLLDVSHLGESEVDWEIAVTATDFTNPATYVFHSGWFTITGANRKNTLRGDYSDWTIDAATGDYILDWDFQDSTGKFDGATGTGRTYGNANLATGEAVFEFSGEVKVPE